MIAFWITLFVQGCTLFGMFYISYRFSQNSHDKIKYLIYLTVFSMMLIMLLFQFEPFGIKKILSTISGGHGGDWLQFWGTYLGIIFSVVLTLYVTNKQGEIDRENARKIHAIEIYIDNLMSALDILIKLQPLIHRCKNYLKIVKSKQVSSLLDRERILLIENIDNENKNMVGELKNIIKKMPLESKKELEKSIERFDASIDSFGNTGGDLEEHDKYVEFAAGFIEDYKCINKFITNEIDEYNKVK